MALAEALLLEVMQIKHDSQLPWLWSQEVQQGKQKYQPYFKTRDTVVQTDVTIKFNDLK